LVGEVSVLAGIMGSNFIAAHSENPFSFASTLIPPNATPSTSSSEYSRGNAFCYAVQGHSSSRRVNVLKKGNDLEKLQALMKILREKQATELSNLVYTVASTSWWKTEDDQAVQPPPTPPQLLRNSSQPMVVQTVEIVPETGIYLLHVVIPIPLLTSPNALDVFVSDDASTVEIFVEGEKELVISLQRKLVDKDNLKAKLAKKKGILTLSCECMEA